MCPGLRADQLAVPRLLRFAGDRSTAARRCARPGQPAGPAASREQAGISREGIIDLLGLLAYAELDAYFRLTEDAALAPSLADKAALGGMAVAEFGHFRLLCDQLTALGGPAGPGDAAVRPGAGRLPRPHRPG